MTMLLIVDYQVTKLDHRILTNKPKIKKRKMPDLLRKRIDELKIISESAKRRAGLYSDLAGVDDKKTAQSLSSLQRAPDPGKKLQKIGFIMFWVPEPSGVTCAIGGPMILAGKYLDRVYNGSTIHDIGSHTKDAVSSINDFKKSIS